VGRYGLLQLGLSDLHETEPLTEADESQCGGSTLNAR
jgi:hypothetical protein